MIKPRPTATNSCDQMVRPNGLIGPGWLAVATASFKRPSAISQHQQHVCVSRTQFCCFTSDRGQRVSVSIPKCLIVSVLVTVKMLELFHTEYFRSWSSFTKCFTCSATMADSYAMKPRSNLVLLNGSS